MNKQLILGIVILFISACSAPKSSTGLEPQANYFQQLGGALDITLSQNAYSPSLAIDGANNPVVSWDEEAGSTRNIYVKRWNGASWQQLGAALNSNYAYFPSLALNSTGNPVVAWEESDGTFLKIYVKRLNGTSWEQLGNPLNNQLTNGYSTKVVLDSSGNPLVSFNESFDFTSSKAYVKRWNDTTGWGSGIRVHDS